MTSGRGCDHQECVWAYHQKRARHSRRTELGLVGGSARIEMMPEKKANMCECVVGRGSRMG